MSDDLGLSADPESLVRNVRARRPGQTARAHKHGEAMESVREATYRGHRIVIRTTYRVEVDGRAIEGHMGVTNDGKVYYHGVPNVSFASAVDLVKKLIDTFPDDFPDRPEGHSGGGHHHADHSEGEVP
jgi:hypothetical protein